MINTRTIKVKSIKKEERITAIIMMKIVIATVIMTITITVMIIMRIKIFNRINI